LLSRSSPFYKGLLSSDFAESVPHRSKRPRQSSPPSVEAPPPITTEQDYEDSDEETDSFLFSKHPPEVHSSSETDELTFRQVVVNHTAFSTYRAILLFLQSGHISFIPLSSSFPDPQARIDFLSAAHDKNPDLPLPVSAKSVYRLADFLGLDELRQRSLYYLKASLSVQNVATELFSPTSINHAEWRTVCIDFVHRHRVAVKTSENWEAVLGRIEAGNCPAAAPVLVQVLRTAGRM
jgi:hypothetical protein